MWVATVEESSCHVGGGGLVYINVYVGGKCQNKIIVNAEGCRFPQQSSELIQEKKG